MITLPAHIKLDEVINLDDFEINLDFVICFNISGFG